MKGLARSMGWIVQGRGVLIEGCGRFRECGADHEVPYPYLEVNYTELNYVQ